MKTPPEDWDDGDPAAEPGRAPDSEYRRRAQPVRVRRRRPREWWAAARRHWKGLLSTALALAAAVALWSLLFASSWFVVRASGQIAIVGNRNTPSSQILAVFSSDLGRNVFFIPLEERRTALEALPWVRQAAVLRLWPAHLQVRVAERTPVAFARAQGQLKMVDADGVLLDRPATGTFDFPVLDGLAGADADAPNTLHWRHARVPQVQQFTTLCTELDRDGAHHSQDLSEVNLADPADVAARVSLPGAATVLVHFGDHGFAARYTLFLSQISAWRQKYPDLASVDLHFDGEAIVNPGTPPPPPAAKPAPKTTPHRGARHG